MRLGRPCFTFSARPRDPFQKSETITGLMGDAWQVSVAWFRGRPAAAVFGLRSSNAEYWLEHVPLTRAEHALRGGVKRAIGFRDV